MKKYTITLPEDLAAEIKKSCLKEGRTFSGIIRKLLQNKQKQEGE